MKNVIDTSNNSDAQKKSYFHSVLEKNYRTIVTICVSLFMLTIILSSILFTKKSPPIVDESTEEAEQEDETKVHLPKSNNANSLRAYNFAMTILMLSGAVYLIFSSNQCTEKKIGCFNFTFRLFFLFWFRVLLMSPFFGSAFLRSNLKRIKKRLDHAEHGGALLLGVNGICVIGHGSSKALSVVSALRLAHSAASHGVMDDLAQLGAQVVSKA